MKNLTAMMVSSGLLCLFVSCGTEYKQANEELLAEKQALTAEIQHLTAAYESLLAEKQVLTAENESLTAANESMLAEKQVLTADNKTMTAANQTLTMASQALTAEKETLKQEIHHLKNQDHYVLSQAGALLDDGDVPGALKAYQGFVRDFPSSSGVDVATKQIAALQDRLEKTRLAEIAKQEKRKLAAIKSLSFGELTSNELIRKYLVGRWVTPDVLGLGAAGGSQYAYKRMLEFKADGRVAVSESSHAYSNVNQMQGYEEKALGKYSITRASYSNTGDPYVLITLPSSKGGVLLDETNVRRRCLFSRFADKSTYVRVD
jgi:hypothetical protein